LFRQFAARDDTAATVRSIKPRLHRTFAVHVHSVRTDDNVPVHDASNIAQTESRTDTFPLPWRAV